MHITDVRIRPTHEGALRAFVNIIFDNCFAVDDIRIIQGPDGLFVSMPNKRLKDGTLSDIAFPINAETRQMIEEKIIATYKKIASGKTTTRTLVVKARTRRTAFGNDS